MIHFNSVSSEADQINETNDSVQFTENGQISIRLNTIIDLFKKFWDWDIRGGSAEKEADDNRGGELLGFDEQVWGRP
jgi:hypothetical protein